MASYDLSITAPEEDVLCRSASYELNYDKLRNTAIPPSGLRFYSFVNLLFFCSDISGFIWLS